MTKEQAKELLPAITHFANGGELVSCRTDKEWFEQSQVYINTEHLHCSNIIQDKHFEARRAYALGEEVQTRHFGTDKWVACKMPAFLRTTQYRPKPKEVYEWQWAYIEYEDYVMSEYHTEEETSEDHDWFKFEPSKRIRK